MNIPIKTWSVYITVNKKVKSIGNFTSTRPPIKEEIKAMALEKGFDFYTFFYFVLVDDGREY
jgi:hypothetical protein